MINTTNTTPQVFFLWASAVMLSASSYVSAHIGYVVWNLQSEPLRCDWALVTSYASLDCKVGALYSTYMIAAAAAACLYVVCNFGKACCWGLLVMQGGMNVQVFYQASDDISYLDYDADECETGLQSFFHDMSQMEMQDNWARCWSVSTIYLLSASVCSVLVSTSDLGVLIAVHCNLLHRTALPCISLPSLSTLTSNTPHLVRGRQLACKLSTLCT